MLCLLLWLIVLFINNAKLISLFISIVTSVTGAHYRVVHIRESRTPASKTPKRGLKYFTFIGILFRKHRFSNFRSFVSYLLFMRFCLFAYFQIKTHSVLFMHVHLICVSVCPLVLSLQTEMIQTKIREMILGEFRIFNFIPEFHHRPFMLTVLSLNLRGSFPASAFFSLPTNLLIIGENMCCYKNRCVKSNVCRPYSFSRIQLAKTSDANQPLGAHFHLL